MLNTHLVRTKIDRLSAADGADTYWRETMLKALDEVDRLTADLENRKRQFDAYCDAEEINNARMEQEISTLQSALDAADKRNDDQKRLSDDARNFLARQSNGTRPKINPPGPINHTEPSFRRRPPVIIKTGKEITRKQRDGG